MTSLPQIHLLFGNQQLKIDETAQAWIEQLLDKRDPQLCYHRFDISQILKESGTESIESKIDQFRMNCETLPFLEDRTIIRVDHLEKLKQKNKKDTSEELGGGNMARLYQLVLKYIKQPPDYCGFVFTAPVTKDQEFSSPLLKAIKANGKIQKFVAYDDDKPIPWILERAGQKQLRFTPSLAQLLLELIGNDLSTLNQELEKLSLLFAGQQVTLQEDDLLNHVQSTKHYSVFRITQALCQKNLVAALETLDQVLMESSSEHVRLFVLVSQQFVKLLNIHYLLAQRLDQQAIITKLKIHPFLGKRLVAQARSFTLPELEKITITLADLDLEFKFNQREARPLFQNLFQNICTGYYRMQN